MDVSWGWVFDAARLSFSYGTSLRLSRSSRIGEITHFFARLFRKWGGQCQLSTILCLMANAVASTRDVTPNLLKMLLTWRSTVRSLINNSFANALLVFPKATWRNTWISRRVRP